jgi:prevent-host-death family protein
MEAYNASVVPRQFGKILRDVQRDLIVILSHGKPAAVMMSMQEYERLRRLDRQVYTAANVPDDLLEAIKSAEP